MEHIDNQAPDSGIVTCPQCKTDTPEHYMIWDGEKTTVCMWCDEESRGFIPGTIREYQQNLYGFEDDNDPNPYHGTYSEE